jgi:hypothetical protein
MIWRDDQIRISTVEVLVFLKVKTGLKFFEKNHRNGQDE